MASSTGIPGPVNVDLALYVSRLESRVEKTKTQQAALHLDLYGSKDSKGVDPGSKVRF